MTPNPTDAAPESSVNNRQSSDNSSWPDVKLNNGHSIPGIGFGTCGRPICPDEVTPESLKAAIDAGFRHLDTSPNYETETIIGKTLSLPGIDRSKLFITTKYEGYHYPLKDRWRGSPLEECRAALDRLNTEYIDLYVIHDPKWVGGDEDVARAWKEMEECVQRGWVRSIGVCNFDIPHLSALLPHATVKPTINQIEFNPLRLHPNIDLLAYMKQNDIALEAYSPMMPLTADPKDEPSAEQVKKCVEGIAMRIGVDVGEVLLSWSRAKGAIPLTRTTKLERIRSALHAGAVELSEDDMAAIDEAAMIKVDTVTDSGQSTIKRSCTIQ